MDLRGGPAQARRVCSEASSVARVGSPLSTGRARGHDSAPAVVVPAFLSPCCAPARGWQMRGSARAGRADPAMCRRPRRIAHAPRGEPRTQRGHRRAHQQFSSAGVPRVSRRSRTQRRVERERRTRAGARLGTATRVAASRARENERPPTSLASTTSALVARALAGGVFRKCGESGRAVARGAHAAEGGARATRAASRVLPRAPPCSTHAPPGVTTKVSPSPLAP